MSTRKIEKNKLVSNDSELFNSARNGNKKNFGRKWRFSAGAAVKTKPKNKTQVLSRITFNVSLKIKPDNQMYANVSDPPPLVSI